MTAEAQLSDIKGAFLEEAFPTGSVTLLLAPLGPEKEALLAPLVHRILSDGSDALLAFSNIPPGRFLWKLSGLGSDVKSHLKARQLRILDWYSHKEEDIQEMVDRGGVLRCPGYLGPLEGALSELIGLADGKGLAILEILTDVIGLEKDEMKEFTFTLIKKLKEGYDTLVLVVDTDFVPVAAIEKLRGQFDRVVEINRERATEEVRWTASIPRGEGRMGHYSLMMEPRFLDFVPKEIDMEALQGEVLVEEKLAEEPCPGCGAPLRGRECNVCGYMPDDPRLAKIKELYEKCEERLKLNPEDTDALFTKAAALARLKDFEMAVRVLNDLTRQDARYPGMWMLKAKLFDRLGDELKANLCRQRALKLEEEEVGLLVEASVLPDNEKFQCPLCQRWLPLDAAICPCGAEFEED